MLATVRARRRRRASFVWLGVAALVLSTAHAAAQDAGPERDDHDPSSGRAPEAPEPEARIPPRPVHAIEPVYPREALASGVEGVSIAVIEIDPDGVVVTCETDVSIGRADLDAAACEALLRAPFVPARRGATPVASRVRFAVRFVLDQLVPDQGPLEARPAMPAPAEAPAATGAIQGRIERLSHGGDEASRAPLPAYVTFTDASGRTRRASPSDEGRFAFERVEVGAGHVRVFAADGALLDTTEVEVTAGEIVELVVTLGRATGALGVTAIVHTSRATALRRSAEAVHVVELQTASQQGADLGEVLAREQGVGVRRSGGLGSSVRFSLNGLTDDQIRFFLDGVPLDWMGFPFGLGDVPVNLIEHVEIYRGVVPIRFGSDALGGAVNLRSRDPVRAPHVSFSYQGGSFGTHRLTLDGGHHFTESGFYARARAFLDRAENDYDVVVDLADESGRPYEASVPRTHDGYEAQGGNLELGFANTSFADRLSVHAYVTDYTRDVQHNVTMDVPYGEVQYGETTGGAVVRFENEWDEGSLSAILAYNYTRSWFTDVSACTYDWFGACIAELGAGEIGRQPANQRRRTHAGLLRLTGEYRPLDVLAVRVSLAPTLSARTGEELADGEGALQQVDIGGEFLGLVGGVEVELDVWEDRIEAIVFAKYYLQSMWSAEIVAPRVTQSIENLFHQPGAGGAIRVLLAERVYVKASYEWATRLLGADEVFGNGGLIYPNLDLQPEVSHNANAGITAEGTETELGVFRGNLNLFLRLPDQLVVLLGQGEFFQYLNVSRAQSIGFELAAGWTSPGDYVVLDANVTFQDFRNTSSEGIFGAYEGDRIPNRPYLFTNATLRIQFDDLFTSHDRLAFSYYFRYVHEFFRNWESIGAGRPNIKHTIDSQLLHTAGLSYSMESDSGRLTTSLEVHNITDAMAFDTFGIQRPGRAIYFKLTTEL